MIQVVVDADGKSTAVSVRGTGSLWEVLNAVQALSRAQGYLLANLKERMSEEGKWEDEWHEEMEDEKCMK
ncbi:MAG: hypothetical protein ACXQT3_02935 [Methermicoccaceae archaeon]